MKTQIQKFIKMSNGQYMKVLFTKWINKGKTTIVCWTMDIVIANSKRQCNDCIRKTKRSPKVIYGQGTGRGLGLEPFKIALKELLGLEQVINNCEIHINPASKKLEKIYSHLERYGYKKEICDNGRLRYSKVIDR